MKSQKQLMKEANDKLMGAKLAFAEIMQGDNPLTFLEMEKLIAKRPEVYGFLAPYLSVSQLERIGERYPEVYSFASAPTERASKNPYKKGKMTARAPLGKQTVLSGDQEMRWLRKTHLPDLAEKFKSAVIYGYLDDPTRIDVYLSRAANIYERPIVFVPVDGD